MSHHPRGRQGRSYCNICLFARVAARKARRAAAAGDPAGRRAVYRDQPPDTYGYVESAGLAPPNFITRPPHGRTTLTGVVPDYFAMNGMHMYMLM